jgi:hypothetical protein
MGVPPITPAEVERTGDPEVRPAARHPYKGSDMAKLVATLTANITNPLVLAARAVLAWCGLRAQVQPSDQAPCGDFRRLNTAAGRAMRPGSRQARRAEALA